MFFLLYNRKAYTLTPNWRRQSTVLILNLMLDFFFCGDPLLYIYTG